MPKNPILDNLSTHLKNAIAKAISLATSLEHAHVHPAHMLLSLIQEEGSIASEILKKEGVTEAAIADVLNAIAPVSERGPGPIATALLPELDDTSKGMLEKSMLLAYEHGHNYVGTEHLLHAMCEVPDAGMKQILKVCKATKKGIQKHTTAVMENISKFPELDDVAHMAEAMEDMPEVDDTQEGQPGPAPSKTKRAKRQAALEAFAVELTNKKLQESIDPVIGRETEIDRLMHILARRNKNNPVLVGEPGVGKTAIVEGLAKRIAEGKVPHALRGKKIYAVDLALMISGTIYRGEFEARLKQIVEEMSNRDDAILFIDELHTLVGAGANQGTMDAANMLKPALARGVLRCIGATTLDEYKKHITADPALERRFQSIDVSEPSVQETKQILKGVKKFYEKHHGVTITPEALAASAELSAKYVHENFLPDKALDLLDEAAALVHVSKASTKTQDALCNIEDELRRIREEKEAAILDEAFDQAMTMKDAEEALLKERKKLQKAVKKEEKSAAVPPVDKSHVADVLSRRLGIAKDRILQDDWATLQSLPKEIEKAIIGQGAAVKTLVNALHQANLRPKTNRPLASFLFAGPSGVGKTSMARKLAEALYHDPKALIKLDMSEFSEQHSTSKLLGSPAGYIGHKERNKFTEQLQKRPYSVVLFDEIDKAHPDVIKLLLQILDEGMLTDSAGKTTSFRHAIVVLTSNIGAELFTSSGIGFDESEPSAELTSKQEQAMTARLKEAFSPALIARLDALCLFAPLSQESLEKIVKQQIKALSTHLKQTKNLTIAPKAKAVRHLAKKAMSKDLGARRAEKLVHDVITDLLLEKLQNETMDTAYHLDIETDGNGLTLITR